VQGNREALSPAHGFPGHLLQPWLLCVNVEAKRIPFYRPDKRKGKANLRKDIIKQNIRAMLDFRNTYQKR
jgi:hypothetical protein